MGIGDSAHPHILLPSPSKAASNSWGSTNSGAVLCKAWTSPGFPRGMWHQDLNILLMKHQGAGRSPRILSHIAGHVLVLPPLHSLLLLWFCLHPETKWHMWVWGAGSPVGMLLSKIPKSHSFWI